MTDVPMVDAVRLQALHRLGLALYVQSGYSSVWPPNVQPGDGVLWVTAVASHAHMDTHMSSTVAEWWKFERSLHMSSNMSRHSLTDAVRDELRAYSKDVQSEGLRDAAERYHAKRQAEDGSA